MSRFDQVLASWIEAPGDPDIEAELDSWINEHPELRERAREMVAVHHGCEMLLAPVRADTTMRLVQRRLLQRRRDRQRRWRLGAGLALAAAVLLVIGLLTIDPTADRGIWGRVITTDPNALVIRRDQAIPAYGGMRLQPGDRLMATAGEGIVILGRLGALLEINGNVELRDDPESHLRAILDRGQLDCRLDQHDGRVPWRFDTPHIQVRITGTRFTLAVDEERSDIQVASGTVELTTHSTGRSFTMGPGDAASIGRLGRIESPDNDAQPPEQTGDSPDTPTTALPAPLFWWPCDENQGAVVRDRGPHALDGRLISQVRRAQGKHDGALSIAGQGLLQIPDHPALDLDRGTIAMWIKPDRPFAEQTAINPKFPLEFFSKCEWQDKRGYELLHPAYSDHRRNIGLRICRPPDQSTGAYDELPAGTDWIHLAATWGDGSIRLYIDGREVARTPDQGPIPGNDMSVRIGNYFFGRIDDIRVYDQPLLQEHIQQVMDP